MKQGSAITKNGDKHMSDIKSLRAFQATQTIQTMLSEISELPIHTACIHKQFIAAIEFMKKKISTLPEQAKIPKPFIPAIQTIQEKISKLSGNHI